MSEEVPICGTGGFNGRVVRLVDGSLVPCKDRCTEIWCPPLTTKTPAITYMPFISDIPIPPKTRFSKKPQIPADPEFCNLGPTEIVEITSPVTGRIWMDRNLGAWRVAENPTDPYSFGDLYQFGRRRDGHQCRLSESTIIQATSNTVAPPDRNKFIDNFDWTDLNIISPTDFWNETNTGINDIICPPGYRLPTAQEWLDEIAGWGPQKAQSAYDFLKLPLAGIRIPLSGISNTGSFGTYHSSSGSSGVQTLEFSLTTANTSNNNFGSGRSIRCIKDL